MAKTPKVLTEAELCIESGTSKHARLLHRYVQQPGVDVAAVVQRCLESGTAKMRAAAWSSWAEVDAPAAERALLARVTPNTSTKVPRDELKWLALVATPACLDLLEKFGALNGPDDLDKATLSRSGQWISASFSRLNQAKAQAWASSFLRFVAGTKDCPAFLLDIGRQLLGNEQLSASTRQKLAKWLAHDQRDRATLSRTDLPAELLELIAEDLPDADAFERLAPLVRKGQLPLTVLTRLQVLPAPLIQLGPELPALFANAQNRDAWVDDFMNLASNVSEPSDEVVAFARTLLTHTSVSSTSQGSVMRWLVGAVRDAATIARRDLPPEVLLEGARAGSAAHAFDVLAPLVAERTLPISVLPTVPCDARWVDAVLELPSSEARFEGLLVLRCPEAVPALLGLVQGLELGVAQKKVLWVLGQIGDPAALPYLQELQHSHRYDALFLEPLIAHCTPRQNDEQRRWSALKK